MDSPLLEAQAFLREILGLDRLTIRLDSFLLDEGQDSPPSRLSARLRFSDRDEPHTLEGSGVGSFHVFFTSLREFLSRSYPSLRHLVFLGIHVRSLPGSDRLHPTDAEAEISLRIRNAEGRETDFVVTSRSLIRAAFVGITEALEYYANTERAYLFLSRQILDAKHARSPFRDLQLLQDRLVQLTAFPV